MTRLRLKAELRMYISQPIKLMLWHSTVILQMPTTKPDWKTLLGCIAKRFSFRTQMEITGMTYLHGLLKWWNGKDSRVLLFLSITKSSSLQELMPNGLSLRTVRKRTANGSLRQNSSTSSFLPIRKVHFCRVCICV